MMDDDDDHDEYEQYEYEDDRVNDETWSSTLSLSLYLTLCSQLNHSLSFKMSKFRQIKIIDTDSNHFLSLFTA